MPSESADTPPHSSSLSAEGCRLLLYNTQHFLGLLDLSGTVVEVNQSVLEMCGLTREQVIGCPIWASSVWLPEERPRLREAVRQAARGEPMAYETEVYSAAGQWMTVDFSVRPIKDDNGATVYLIAEGHDSTQRKQVELALEEQRVFLQTVLDNISDGIAACNAEGMLSVFNPATRVLHNLREFPLPSSEWAEHYDLYQADGTTPLQAEEVPLYRALQGEVVRDVEMVIAPEGGERRRLLASGRALESTNGERLGAVVAMRDITAARAAETALRESDALHRAVIEVLSEGVVQYARNGRVTLCNTAAERILGLTREQLLEEDSVDARWRMVHEDGTPFVGNTHPAMATLRSGEPQEGVVLGVHKPNGILTWMLVNCQPLWRLGEATPYAAVSSFTDITHMKQTEAQLRYASLHDGLTGLPGRELFKDRLEQAVIHAARDPNFCFAVLYIDLDGFKAVNDTLGHAIGDNLLVTVARQLERCVRERDTAARLSGDEFVILFEYLFHREDAIQLAERVVRDLAISVNVAGKEVSVGASIGVVLSGQQLRARDLLDAADRAMYQAKAAGKARYHVFNEATA